MDRGVHKIEIPALICHAAVSNYRPEILPGNKWRKPENSARIQNDSHDILILERPQSRLHGPGAAPGGNYPEPGIKSCVQAFDDLIAKNHVMV